MKVLFERILGTPKEFEFICPEIEDELVMNPINKPTDDAGWSEYQIFVIEALRDLKHDVAAIKKDQNKLTTEIALLKLKSSFWGALAGLAAYAAVWGVELLKRKP